MATSGQAKFLLLLSAVGIGVVCFPLEPLPGKSGEDQVREAVRKAEDAAKKAAEESAKHGDNAAELRVAAIKAKLAAQRAIKQRLHLAQHHFSPKLKTLRKWGHAMKPLVQAKHYNKLLPFGRRHQRRPQQRNLFSNMITLNDLASDGVPQDAYQEDTALEDRLALEAEEDKKFGPTYTGNGDYTFSRSSLTGKDATQSIQNQVARESARELKEIQQQINAESQNSLGKTTMGEAISSFQGTPSPQPVGAQQKPKARNGMMEIQSGLSNGLTNGLTNAEGMNSNADLLTPSVDNGESNALGLNSFTGLGGEPQPGDIDSNMADVASMQNPGQTEQIGEGQATMEGSDGETIQSAASALAAGAGQSAFGNSNQGLPNDLGIVPEAAGQAASSELEGGAVLEPEGLSPGGLMLSGNSLSGGNMKKSKIKGR